MNKKHLYLLIAVLVIVVAFAGYTALTWETDCGRDQTCFTNLANNCQKAVLRKYIGDVEFEFRTRGCVLEKKMIGSLGSPEKVGYSMLCPFEQGKFNNLTLDLITFEIDKCSGELRNIVDSI